MAKAQFPILITVEESAVGTVMRLLHTTPGVLSFNVDLDHMKKGKANGSGTGKARMRDALTPMLEKMGKGVVARQDILRVYMEINPGVEASAGSAFITRTIASKHIAKVGTGKYKVTALGLKRLKEQKAQAAETKPS